MIAIWGGLLMETHGIPTNRQIEVLQMLADGLRYKHIAQYCGISRRTVKNYINRACILLDVHTAHQAIAEGFRRGILR